MAKLCISNGFSGSDPRHHAAGPARAFGRRRRKSRSARARAHVARLTGAWLMDQQECSGDFSR